MAQYPEWQECVDAQGGMDGMPNVINLMEDAATEGRFLSGQAGSHSQGTSGMMLLTRSSHVNVPISLSYLVQRPGEKHLELKTRNGEGCVGRWQTVAAPMASWGEDAPHLAMGHVPCDLHQL